MSEAIGDIHQNLRYTQEKYLWVQANQSLPREIRDQSHRVRMKYRRPHSTLNLLLDGVSEGGMRLGSLSFKAEG